MKEQLNVLYIKTMEQKDTQIAQMDARFNYFENQKRLMYLEKIMTSALNKLNKNAFHIVTSDTFSTSVDNCTVNFQSGRLAKKGNNTEGGNLYAIENFDYLENQKRITYLEKIVAQIINKVGLNLDYFLTNSYRKYINECTLNFEAKRNRDPYNNSSFSFCENQKRLMYLEKIVAQTLNHINPKALDIIVSDPFIQSVNRSVMDFESRKLSS